MPGQTQKPIRSLGVLTGGGDVPGLNPAIKALVYRAEHMGIRVVGLRSGWKGITYIDRSRSLDSLVFNQEDPKTWQHSYLMPLNRLNTRTIDRRGGTILQSSRTNPARIRVSELPPHLSSYGEQQSTGRESLSTASALLQDLIARLSFSACLVVMQVSPRSRRQSLPGLIVC